MENNKRIRIIKKNRHSTQWLAFLVVQNLAVTVAASRRRGRTADTNTTAQENETKAAEAGLCMYRARGRDKSPGAAQPNPPSAQSYRLMA
jgi:predicted Zn-dependent protease